MNIFKEQPDFIDLDPRKDRKIGYAVTPEFMLVRHQAILPPKLVHGKRILDLGSCLAATGAWCLSNGASFYQGIEIDDQFVKDSTFCLQKYYPNDTWAISKKSIEEFLSNIEERFDILIASGIMYGSEDPAKLLQQFCNSADIIVIESMQTETIFHTQILSRKTLDVIAQDPRIIEFLESSSYITVGRRGMVASGNKTIQFPGFNPSMGAIKFIMAQFGFDCHDHAYRELRNKIPSEYSPTKRFALHFKKNPKLEKREFGLKNAVSDPKNILNILKWNSK
jgi:hypothetical protein